MICNVFKRKRRRDGKVHVSRCYYAKIRLPGDHRVSVIPLGVTDKQVAQEKVSQIVREKEKESVGLLPPKPLREAAQKALAVHMQDYILNLRTVGRDEKYIRGVEKQLEVLRSGCGWKVIKDVTANSFEQWRTQQKKSAKTLNEYLIAANAFFNWLKRHSKGLIPNPLEYVEKAQGNGEPTFERRAYAESELRKLVAVAGNRKAVYLTAAQTGLRRNELTCLEWRDVHLDCEAPFITARGSTTKNGKQAAIPLHNDVAEALRELRSKGGAASDRVFAGLMPRMEKVRADLQAAGIPYVNDKGQRADFQSLRKAFQMLLTLNGTLPRVAMEAMRHSDMKLTMKTYTDAGMLPTGEAIRALPSLNGANSEPKKGTQKGTQNPVPESPIVSQGVTQNILSDEPGSGINTGFWRDEARSVTQSPESANGARCRVRTCDFLRVKQALYH